MSTPKSRRSGQSCYYKQNKAKQMIATIGIQPSEVSNIISLARNSITPISENVNSKIKKSLEVSP